MWATAIVMRHPFGQDSPEMPLVERNHPIETLSTRRSDEPFAIGVRLRGAHRRLQDVHPHGLQGAVHRGEDRVVIVQHEPIRALARHTGSKLLHRPLSGRMFGHVPVQQFARADIEHDVGTVPSR